MIPYLIGFVVGAMTGLLAVMMIASWEVEHA